MPKCPTVLIEAIDDRKVSIVIRTEGRDVALEMPVPEQKHTGEALDDRTRRAIHSLMDSLDEWILAGSPFTRIR